MKQRDGKPDRFLFEWRFIPMNEQPRIAPNCKKSSSYPSLQMPPGLLCTARRLTFMLCGCSSHYDPHFAAEGPAITQMQAEEMSFDLELFYSDALWLNPGLRLSSILKSPGVSVCIQPEKQNQQEIYIKDFKKLAHVIVEGARQVGNPEGRLSGKAGWNSLEWAKTAVRKQNFTFWEAPLLFVPFNE